VPNRSYGASLLPKSLEKAALLGLHLTGLSLLSSPSVGSPLDYGSDKARLVGVSSIELLERLSARLPVLESFRSHIPGHDLLQRRSDERFDRTTSCVRLGPLSV
jgi:hypothetical protein